MFLFQKIFQNTSLNNIVSHWQLFLTILINSCLKKEVFPYDLKYADITPIFKKEDSLSKENYRLVSILPYLSKVFERILYKQIDSFMKNKILPQLCVFRKYCNAQYSLLKMTKNLNLWKAFDTINHSLLLAKLKANGFSNQALLQSYICNRF